MPRPVIALASVLVVAVLVAACGAGASPAPSAAGPAAATGTVPASSPPAPSSPASAPAATTTGTPAPSPVATGSAGSPSAAPAVAALLGHPWAAATLTDVTTGKPFRIADLAGRTVFVEAMAIWCSNCRAQQGRFKDALARLDPAKVAYVVMTVDPSETAEALARYKADRGFTGTYAVAGKDVSAALAAEFGANVLNPPTVPLIHIRPDGSVAFRTGPESVDEIVKLAGG